MSRLHTTIGRTTKKRENDCTKFIRAITIKILIEETEFTADMILTYLNSYFFEASLILVILNRTYDLSIIIYKIIY